MLTACCHDICAECPIVNDKLCNGHGICGYDADIKSAACLCNQGWEGADCTDGTWMMQVVHVLPCDAPQRLLLWGVPCAESSSGSGVSVEGVFLIIVLILLVGVLGSAYVTWQHVWVHRCEHSVCCNAPCRCVVCGPGDSPVPCVSCSGYMYVKLRKLQINPDSYSGLRGKFNELGTLAG